MATIPKEVLVELARTLERVSLGVRNPEAAKKACERMDRAREELRKKFGEFAVPFIREFRDEE
jgi:hypothetical protein